MKSKIITLMFSGLLAGSLAVSAQDNPPAATAATDPSATVTNTPAQPDASTATNAVAQPDSAAVTAAPVPDGTGAAGVAKEERATPKKNSAIIPLIVMDDVPLSDAIKNLARQAEINYMLDPAIPYGQPGPNNVPTPQPTVSIRWENITAEQALLALLGNYRLQLVEDPKTKISRVTVKDPAAPDPLLTRIFQLKYASPSNVLTSVQTILDPKRSKVVGDTRTSQLVVLATEKELDAVDHLIERLDQITKQVLIEAQLLETSMNPSTIKGIDWSGTLAAQHVVAGNNALPGVAPTGPTTALDANGNPVTVPGSPGSIGGILSDPKLLMSASQGAFFNPATAFLNADGFSAVISFLNQNSEARVIATPRAVTLDNESATLSVTRAVPIINVAAGTQNTAGGSQITYTNLGVILNVVPRISANNFVNLRVVPEVSRIFATVSKNINNALFQADEYDIRRIETHVMIPSGNTLVLGGLVSDDIRNESTKVPGLGDVPFLGRLFRRDSKSRQKSNLLIFVTPTIVQDSDYQASQTDFLKTPKGHESEKEWSAWDSGKPYDWSKIFK